MPADQSDEMGVADHNVTESNVSPNEVCDRVLLGKIRLFYKS